MNVSRARPGSKAAGRLLASSPLEELERLHPQSVKALKALVAGRGGRNSLSRLGAVKTILEFSMAKPKQELGLTGNITYQVVDPFAKRAR